MPKKNDGKIIIGGSRPDNRQPPFVGTLLTDHQKKLVRQTLESEGITCKEELESAGCLKKCLKKVPFFADVKSVPGNRGTYDVVMAGQQVARGGFDFLFR